MMRLGARLAFAVGGLVLALAVAEVTMRALGVGQVMTYEASASCGYLMRPSQQVSTYGNVISISSLGLRGPELKEPKPPNSLRVLFAGDSVTYGGGQVAEPDLFVRRIETLAAAEGLRVESVNLSAPGWSPMNWSGWLNSHGALGADILVPVIPTADLRRPFSTLGSMGVFDHQPALRLSIFWLKLRQRRAFGLPPSDENLHMNVLALKQMRERFADKPFLAVFVESQIGEEGLHPEYWTQFEAIFPDRVDLRNGLAPADFIDGAHLTAAGHADVAQRIWAQLGPQLRELLRARAARPL
jgi:hypothetical protein